MWIGGIRYLAENIAGNPDLIISVEEVYKGTSQEHRACHVVNYCVHVIGSITLSRKLPAQQKMMQRWQGRP